MPLAPAIEFHFDDEWPEPTEIPYNKLSRIFVVGLLRRMKGLVTNG